jgi:C4-dicarboxylate-specific signal transduction histidine kinase
MRAAAWWAVLLMASSALLVASLCGYLHARAVDRVVAAGRAAAELAQVRDQSRRLTDVLDRQQKGDASTLDAQLFAAFAKLERLWREQSERIASSARAEVEAELRALRNAAEAQFQRAPEEHNGVALHSDWTGPAQRLSQTLDRLQVSLAHEAQVGSSDAQGTQTAASLALGVLAMALVVAIVLAVRAPKRPGPQGLAHPADDGAELEKFAARVAHDVLSPLQAVTTAFEVATRTTDPDKLARCQAAGKASIKRVQRVVEGLFDFARADAAPERDVAANVPEVVAEVRSELQDRAEDEHVELRFEPVPLCSAAISPRALSTLLVHLLRNGIQYMPEQAERWVSLRVSCRQGRIFMEIQDNGGGIAEESLGRLFTPYVRPKGMKKTGLGLGLATVKRIVEAHGGRLSVRTSTRQGTLFTVDLPMAASSGPSADRPPYLT